jgi:hypothetical protein
MTDVRAAATVAERVEAVRREIAAACDRAGRNPAAVTLIGVSKTQGLEAIADAAAAGVMDLGENRAQELVPKADEVTSRGLAVRWHFIGHLQRNKAGDVLPYITSLHSLDSERLIDAITRAVERGGPRRAADPLPCYLQVNVTGEPSKEGVEPDALPRLLATAVGCPYIEVVGLMTVAPLVDAPEASRPAFRSLRRLAEAHGLKGLSMGMTNDFVVAIEEGATAVRVGRAIFGDRND